MFLFLNFYYFLSNHFEHAAKLFPTNYKKMKKGKRFGEKRIEKT